MSRVAHQEQSQTLSDRYHTESQKAVQEAIQQLDKRLKLLRENVIPPQPYLLSIPTDYPGKVYKSFISSWYAGTPFQPHEEELQYMSFHSRHNIGEELLKIEGGLIDADGNLVHEDSQLHDRDYTASVAPADLPARKKISLKDYKTKDKSNHVQPAARSTNKLAEEAMRTDSTITVSRTGGKARARRDVDQEGTESDASSMRINRTSTVPPKIREPDSPSPPKRRKLSSEEPKSGDDTTRLAKPGSSREKRSLPALLSPTLPASKAGKTNKGLPSLLSPDLPKTLEIALAEGQPRRSDQVRSLLGDAFGSPAEKKVAEKSSAETGRGRSESQLSIKSQPLVAKTSPLLNSATKLNAKIATAIPNGVRLSPGPRQKQIIVLKYGKKNRRRVEMLLRFPPKPKKVKPREDSPSRRPPDVIHQNATTPVKPEKKRPTEGSPDRAAKKLKAAGNTPDRPRTPMTSVKTPVAVGSTKKLEPQLTPRKELKSSAMQRMASSDGIDAKTPPIDRGRTSTPVHLVPSRESPASSSTSMPRESDRAAWHEVNTKYHKLGRELKTEAQRLAPSTSEMDQVLSVVNHIEALLCFMINLSAQYHSRNSDSGWETIMPYFIAVFKASRKFRHLHGLVILLGAVCRQIWHGHNMERLYRDPLPDESLNSAPTPGSDGNTRTDDTEKYRKRYLDFKTQLVQNSRELQKAWQDGSRYLSTYLLEHEYPRTWSRRTKDTSHRSFEKVNPSKISKDFYLPLDPNTTVFEAARFALSLMEEWTEKENVAWKGKIDF